MNSDILGFVGKIGTWPGEKWFADTKQVQSNMRLTRSKFRKVGVDNLALKGGGIEYERNEDKITDGCRVTGMESVLFIGRMWFRVGRIEFITGD